MSLYSTLTSFVKSNLFKILSKSLFFISNFQQKSSLKTFIYYPQLNLFMKKRVILYLIILNLLLLFTINNSMAVVYLSELDDAYNLGDMINLEVSISPIEKGPISIKLVCDNKES